MVSKLRYFRSKKAFIKWAKSLGIHIKKAAKQWKGPGYYYHRGKGYICKYSKARDLKRGGKVGRGPWRHTHDLAKRIIKKTIKHVKLAAKVAKKVIEKKRKRKVSTKTILLKTIARKPKRLDPEAKEIADYVWNNLKTLRSRGKWTYIMVYNIAKLLVDNARKQGVDVKSIDVLYDFDWSLTYHEVKAQAVKKVFKGVAEEYYGITDEDVKLMMQYYEQLAESLEEYR